MPKNFVAPTVVGICILLSAVSLKGQEPLNEPGKFSDGQSQTASEQQYFAPASGPSSSPRLVPQRVTHALSLGTDKSHVAPAAKTQPIAAKKIPRADRLTHPDSGPLRIADFVAPGATFESFNVTRSVASSNQFFDPDPSFQSFPVESVQLRHHNYFGVDPDECCDEWDSFCDCGGLNFNPGHLGRKWLRGNDPCERTEPICGKHGCRNCKSKCNSCR